MGSSSSKSRVTKRGNASTRGSTRGAGASIGTGSSGRRRVTANQMQTTRLDFPEIVTFNPIYSHLECYIRQLNWWILDGQLKGPPFRLNKGGPAAPNGECGSVGQWSYCKMNEKYKQPPASRYIGAAAPGFNMETGLSQTIQTTIQICHQQPLEDANVRTALLYLVERLAYQGLAIRTDLDLFSIYAHLKSMSTDGYAPPPEDVVGTHIMNILGLATFKAPVEWENRMILANRIKVELHADILEVQLYYQELQQLSAYPFNFELRDVKQAPKQASSRGKTLPRLETPLGTIPPAALLPRPHVQNVPDTSSYTDQFQGMEELRRQISMARRQAADIAEESTSPWQELGLGAAEIMLARVEGLLQKGATQPSSSNTKILSSIPSASAFTPTSGSSSIFTSHGTQALQLPLDWTIPVNPILTNPTTQSNLPGDMPLNAYSDTAVPSDRLTFSYLLQLWALENGKTQRDLPTFGGKLLDLQLLAFSINSLGGRAEMQRDASLWKQLALRLGLIDHNMQNDENSERAASLLQRAQEELLVPFEQFCINWGHLPEEDRVRGLAQYVTVTKNNLPHSTPEVSDTFLPTPAILSHESALTSSPISPPELHEAIKLVDLYFHGFYPGVRLHTKIERLFKLPASELPKYTWARRRLDFLTKFSQNHAGRTIDQIIAYLAVGIQQQVSRKKLTLTPPSGWPIDSVKIVEILPPTSSAMFSLPLIVQANQFVEKTLQDVEDVRPLRKRVELPDIHRQALKALVTEAYDLALFFYRAVALHYMLFLNEKDTRSTMMHAMLVIEQFFLSSTGYPAHIMSLESAVTSVTSIRDVVNSMRDAYAKRYHEYLKLKPKAEETRGGGVKP